MKKIRVTIWNEYRHEKSEPAIGELYPKGIHGAIGEMLAGYDRYEVTLAALDDPEQGLPDEVLNNTDVLLWWGHMCHGEVRDDIVAKVVDRVYTKGMGFIGLHSAHASKPFTRLIGTTGNLSWGDEQHELLWNLMPNHPIAAGIPEHIDLESEEMYGEPFYIPQPDELVFTSWFEHGNIFRSGCCYYRGTGKVFYFQPGHESCRSYYNPDVQRIIRNAIDWAAPNEFGYRLPDGCEYRRNVV